MTGFLRSSCWANGWILYIQIEVVEGTNWISHSYMGVLSLTYAFHICSKSLNLSIDFLISLMVFEKDETDDRDISNQMEVFYNFASLPTHQTEKFFCEHHLIWR